jgi:antitoxin HicB
MTLSYPIKLEADDNETLLVTCPALPEVTTFGEDEAKAINHARDAIEEAIAARMAHGREVPEPKGKRGVLVALPMQTSLKVELYRLLKRENITRAELMRRLNWKRESVDRLFRLDHATRLEQFDAAFRALGRQVEISIS